MFSPGVSSLRESKERKYMISTLDKPNGLVGDKSHINSNYVMLILIAFVYLLLTMCILIEYTKKLLRTYFKINN